MWCPACGNDNKDGARFCSMCGTALTATPTYATSLSAPFAPSYVGATASDPYGLPAPATPAPNATESLYDQTPTRSLDDPAGEEATEYVDFTLYTTYADRREHAKDRALTILKSYLPGMALTMGMVVGLTLIIGTFQDDPATNLLMGFIMAPFGQLAILLWKHVPCLRPFGGDWVYWYGNVFAIVLTIVVNVVKIAAQVFLPFVLLCVAVPLFSLVPFLPAVLVVIEPAACIGLAIYVFVLGHKMRKLEEQVTVEAAC